MGKSKEIAELVTRERERQHITYRELAEKIGCSTNALLHWKQGRNGITLERADRALKALGLSVTIGKEEDDD